MNARKASKKGTGLSSILIAVLLSLLAALFLFPYFWMVTTALKPIDQISKFWEILPNPVTLRSFKEGLELAPFFKYTLNTIRIGVLSVAGVLISCSLVAFGFAKFQAKSKKLLFMVLLATMMVPQTVTLIPAYMLYSRLGWVNTIIPLTLPMFFGGSAFNIFLLRQFFSSLPSELGEAALIDGCNWMRIFVKIYLPNTVPALLVVTINTLVFVWNDYMNPLVYLGKPSDYTIALGLNMFKGQHGGVIDSGPLMAMASITILPLLLLYVGFQKYFVEGIATSGIKG